MNILFVGKRELNSASGIEKKMDGQITAFQNLGHVVYYTFFSEGKVLAKSTDGEVIELCEYENNIYSMYLANEKAIRILLKKKPNFFHMFYMRKGMCSPIHLSNLKLMKKRNMVLLEEIPTYPYDDELLKMPGLGLKIYFLIDAMTRNFMKKHMDYFVIYNDDKEIFGIPTIHIENGINVLSVPVCDLPDYEEEMHILTVSAMYFWHGYDRLIRGLADYYKKNVNPTIKVFIEMVGDGICRAEWEALADDLGVKDYIHFHGMLSGQELDDVFNKCHVAVSSLGIFRKKIYITSELKIREYMARGIPFVMSSVDRSLPEKSNFYKKIDDNETNVNIEEIIDFYSRLRQYNDWKENMRLYAEKEFSWERQLKKVLDSVSTER